MIETFVLEATTLVNMSGFSRTFCFGKQDLYDKWEHGVIFGALKNMSIVYCLLSSPYSSSKRWTNFHEILVLVDFCTFC